MHPKQNTLNTILRCLIYAGLFAVLFVPLMVSRTMFFPFITGKNFTFRILIEVIASAWLILALRDELFRPKRSWLLYAVTAFTVFIGIADVFGVNFSKSFWSNFERMEGYATLLHLFIYFIVASAMLNTTRLWGWFFHTTIGVSAIVGIYGILQLTGKIVINQGGARLDATFGNATYLAVYMIFHIFFTSMYLLRHRGSAAVKIVYSALIALQFFTLYHTATRGALLGLLGGVILSLLLLAFTQKERPILRRGALGATLLVLVISGSFWMLRNTDFVRSNKVLERFASISLNEARPRMMVWGAALQAFKERPVFGWGQDNFEVAFNKYYDPGMYSQEPWFDRTHNIFFDWLIAGGIFGFVGYLSMFGVMLYLLWRGGEGAFHFSTADKSILTGLLAGYFFHNIFVFDNITSYIFFFSVLAYLHAAYGEAFSEKLSGKIQYISVVAERLASPLIVVALVFVIYFVNIKGIVQAKTLIQAISPQDAGISKNIEYFQKTIQSHEIGRVEAREQLLQAALSIRDVDGVSDEDKQRVVMFAREEMEDELRVTPESTRLHLFYGTFLRAIGEYDLALAELEKASVLSPDKQQIDFELALVHWTRQEYDESLGYLKHAYDNAPAYDEARALYAAIAIYAGKEDIAGVLLAEKPNIEISDGRILQAYISKNSNEKVLEIWRKRVEQKPDEPQFRLSLAAALLNTGRRDESIGEIEKAIALKPEFKEEGEFFISEIRAGRNP